MSSPPEESAPDELEQLPSNNVANADSDFATIVAAYPAASQWSPATISSLQSAISDHYPDVDWTESQWTRRIIDAILDADKDWNWMRLTTCSNTEYFSLSTHTITLLAALFYSNLLKDARSEYSSARLDLIASSRPTDAHRIGYPIFRVDYTSDEEFALYKTCWEQYLEVEFYIPGIMNQADVAWEWIEDRERLDGKDSRAVRANFHRLCRNGTLPHSLSACWICLMVDRQAIETMLRAYGPPTLEFFALDPPGTEPTAVPYLPYLTAVDTNEQSDHEDKDEDDAESGDDPGEEDDTENNRDVDMGYPGYFKCALKAVFRLWEYEQVLPPDEYYPRDGNIWGDDEFSYVAPRDP